MLLETIIHRDSDYFRIQASKTFPRPSKLSEDIFLSFSERASVVTNLSKEEVLVAGILGGAITNGEAMLRPQDGYPTTLTHALRNMFFGMMTADNRWEALKKKELPLPILDYGGGVGFFSCYLAARVPGKVYHYDQPGVQNDFSLPILAKHGVEKWSGQEVGTIVLYNVLEHIEDAMDLVGKLEGKCKKLYATLDNSSGDATDVLQDKEAKALIRQLFKNGQLLPVDGTTRVEQSKMYEFLWLGGQ